MPSKPKTKPKTEKPPVSKPEPKKEALDLSCLGEKGAKQAAHFLAKASLRRKVDPERVLAACLHYCALLSMKRHGIHYVLQEIETATRCKIK
tara:strand:+ start:1184 stop:1459 length:276 start_codon:yes stop_codon:yes gene_type:complete